MTRKTRLKLLYFRALLVLGSLASMAMAIGAEDYWD